MRKVFLYLAVVSSLWAQSGPPLSLSLSEAIQRGLKTNLAVLERETGDRLARVDRIRALSALLPTATGTVAQNVQELNLAVFGFRFPGVPSIIGPFGYQDIRGNASVNLVDWSARKSLQASEQNLQGGRTEHAGRARPGHRGGGEFVLEYHRRSGPGGSGALGSRRRRRRSMSGPAISIRRGFRRPLTNCARKSS